LFLSALKNNDIELAGQYFALNTNEQSPYYLTRQEWIDGLNQTQKEGKIQSIIETLKKMQPSTNKDWGADQFVYVVLNGNGLAQYSLFLKLNKYSNVWKIESM